MKKFSVLIYLSLMGSAFAEPMTFQAGGDYEDCRDCAFIQASGDITEETPSSFISFINNNSGYVPKRVRLSSPGGNLKAGLELGEMFRAREFATEVGGDQVDAEGSPAFGGRASKRMPGVCASACAYAFLGGTERRFEDASKLGFHRFFRENALSDPTMKLFDGNDLDSTQRITASLALYITRMGVDGKLAAIAAEAGPNQMRWIKQDEARDLRLIYEPNAWSPWRVEAYRKGAIAITETNNGARKIVVSCSRRYGPQVVLTETNSATGVAEWFENSRTCAFGGAHPVLGAQVEPDHIQVIRRSEGGAIVRFRLPSSSPPLTSSALFPRSTGAYPTACSSEGYGGSRINFIPTVRLALKNCIED